MRRELALWVLLVAVGGCNKTSGSAGAPPPERTRDSTRSQSLMPSTTDTNTTGDTGWKVPVPRRWMSNGCSDSAIVRRCLSMSSRSSAATSVGGSRVMWVGIDRASGSPKDSRTCCSARP